MQKIASFTLAATVLAPSVALAHPGHVAEQAGHNHWIAVAALAAAAVVGGLYVARKIKAKRAGAKSETTA